MTDEPQNHRPGRDEGRGPDESRNHDDDRSHGRTTTIIVNGREKTVTQRGLSSDELVELAFENPPTGKLICFTITYRRGPGNNPEGTLEEGDSVKINEGMIFNVTATDKS